MSQSSDNDRDSVAADSLYAWLILAMLSLAYFTLYLHRNVVNYVQPPLKADLNLSSMQLNSLLWLFLMPYALAQIFVGYLGDRYRRRTLLLASLVGSATVLALTGIARSFWDLAAWRVLLAIAQSASVPAIAGIMADCFTERTRATAVSVYLLSSPISLMAAGSLGGVVADEAGWRATMFVFAGFGAGVAGLLYLCLVEPARTDRVKGHGLGEHGDSLRATLWAVLRIPTFLLLMLSYVLASNIIQLTQFLLPRYFHDEFHLGLAGAGTMATFAVQSGTILGLLVGGPWADVWARRRISGRFEVQIIGLAQCIPALLVMGLSKSNLVLVVAMVGFGVGVGLYLSNLWTTTFQVIDPAARSTAIGLLNVAAGVFGSWVAPVIGRLHDTRVIESWGAVFVGTAVATCLALALLAYATVRHLPRNFLATAK